MDCLMASILVSAVRAHFEEHRAKQGNDEQSMQMQTFDFQPGPISRILDLLFRLCCIFSLILRSLLTSFSQKQALTYDPSSSTGKMKP